MGYHRWWTVLKILYLGNSLVCRLYLILTKVVFESVAKANLVNAACRYKRSASEINLPGILSIFLVFCQSPGISKYFAELSVDNGNGTEQFGVFPMFFNRIAPVLVPWLTIVFRILLVRASFPRCWRDSVNVLIPKRLPCSVVTEWRPISLTAILSKCF